MPVPQFVSVDEYLRSSYEHDPEFVEGELVERDLPTIAHGQLQAALCAFLFPKRREWGLQVLSNTRVQVAEGVFRLPDVCLISSDPPQQGVICIAPICVMEIVSPDDGMENLRLKAREYLNLGVRHVWSVSPISGECYEHGHPIMQPVEDGVLRVTGTPIEIPVTTILAAI